MQTFSRFLVATSLVILMSDATLAEELTLPSVVRAAVGSGQIAQTEDFVPVVRSHARALVRADLNGDGRDDYALLLIDRAKRGFRFVLALSRGTGFQVAASRRFAPLASSKDGFVYTTITYKPRGLPGPAERTHCPLAPAEKRAFKKLQAIELWTGAHLDSMTPPADLDLGEDLAYCSQVYYVQAGKLQQFEVCD